MMVAKRLGGLLMLAALLAAAAGQQSNGEHEDQPDQQQLDHQHADQQHQVLSLASPPQPVQSASQLPSSIGQSSASPVRMERVDGPSSPPSIGQLSQQLGAGSSRVAVQSMQQQPMQPVPQQQQQNQQQQPQQQQQHQQQQQQHQLPPMQPPQVQVLQQQQQQQPQQQQQQQQQQQLMRPQAQRPQQPMQTQQPQQPQPQPQQPALQQVASQPMLAAPSSPQPIVIQYQAAPVTSLVPEQQPPQQVQQQQPPPMQPVPQQHQPAHQHQHQHQHQQQPQQQPPQQAAQRPPASLSSYSAAPSYQHSSSPLYLGHNPFIEILRPNSYADDNIVTLNLSHSHIYEIDSDAFVGQRFEHIDLSNNKLGLIHSRSFRIGPNHSRHTPYNPNGNGSRAGANAYPPRRPPPAHPKSVTIDFSHNPAIVALSGAFDHIDVPNCLLNFTNSTVELKFGAFKKYFKEHPGHLVDIESVDCCEQEWLLGYKHNFVLRTHCDHEPSLFLSKVPQQTIIDSCIAYVTSARHSMTIQGPSLIHQVAAAPRSHSSSHADNQYLTYVILGGTAMILTSLSIYIIFYMFSLKAAFVYQMQNKS